MVTKLSYDFKFSEKFEGQEIWPKLRKNETPYVFPRRPQFYATVSNAF